MSACEFTPVENQAVALATSRSRLGVVKLH